MTFRETHVRSGVPLCGHSPCRQSLWISRDFCATCPGGPVRRARAKATPVATSRHRDSASPMSVRGSPSHSSESPFLLLLDVARVHSNDQGRNARVQRLQGVLHSQDGPLQAVFGGEVASSRREEKVGWKCTSSRSRPLLAAGLESPTTQRPAPNALTRRRATRSMWLTGRVSH